MLDKALQGMDKARQFVILKNWQGIIHISGPELLSWYEIAKRLCNQDTSYIQQLRYHELYECEIRPKVSNLTSLHNSVLSRMQKFRKLT